MFAEATRLFNFRLKQQRGLMSTLCCPSFELKGPHCIGIALKWELVVVVSSGWSTAAILPVLTHKTNRSCPIPEKHNFQIEWDSLSTVTFKKVFYVTTVPVQW